MSQAARGTRSATSTNMTKTKKLSISPTSSTSAPANSNSRLLLLVVLINLFVLGPETTQAWRLFASRLAGPDQGIEPTSGRSFSDHYQPFYNNVYGLAASNQNNNNQHNYHHYQPSQLLTPSTGPGQLSGLRDQQTNLRVSSYLNEQLIGVGSEAAANQPPLAASQPAALPPPPQAAALSAAPQPSSAPEAHPSPPPPSQPISSPPSEAQPVKARDASPEVKGKQQQEASGDSEPASPSPLGKIIDSVLSSALNESLSSRSQTAALAEQSNATQQSPGGRLLGNVASQILKPRNKSSLHNDNKRGGGGGVASAEQQIINQHARVHLAGHSHQRLLPTKHRDNKLAGQLSDSSSSSSSSSTATGSSFVEPLYSLLLNNFKSGITSRSSIKKAISDNKLARTLTSVTKTMGSNKYVAGAGAAAALAALGLTMSKLLTPYLFAGTYSKLGEPMTMSGSNLFNSYMLNTDRNYQPLMSASSSSAPSSMFFLPPSQDPLMSTSSSSLPRISPTQNNLFQANSDMISGNLQAYLDQQQQLQFSSPSQPPMSAIGTTGSKQIDLSPASDINGYYTNFYNNAPPEDQLVASSSYPTSIKDIQNQPTTGSSSSNSNDQMIMSAASSINSLGYAPSSASFMPRRSGTVSLKMDEATRNLLHQMINQRQREQPLPQVTTNYYGQAGSPNQQQQQQPQLDYSSSSWTASNVNSVIGDENSAAINGQQPQPQQQQQQPSVSLYYYNAPGSADGSSLIEQPAQQQQINQGGQLSSLSSSTTQQVESYSPSTANANKKKQWLSPAGHQQRSVGEAQTRLESRGWQSIQQLQASQSTAKNKQPPAGDNGLYQAVNSRQNVSTTVNANERDQRDVVQWQRRAISRPPKTTTSSKTSTSSKTTTSSSSSSGTKTGKVYIKQRRPVAGEFQLNSTGSPVDTQTIDYGLPQDASSATGDENRQQSGVLFDLQPPPEATSTQSSDNNGVRLQYLQHVRQQQQDEDDKQNAIKVIEMNGNNQTLQLADSMEASSTSPANNGDIISSSSAALSLGDVVVADSRQDERHENHQHRQDHLQRDNQSMDSTPGRAYRGPVAGSIVSNGGGGGGLASGHLAAEIR